MKETTNKYPCAACSNLRGMHLVVKDEKGSFVEGGELRGVLHTYREIGTHMSKDADMSFLLCRFCIKEVMAFILTKSAKENTSSKQHIKDVSDSLSQLKGALQKIADKLESQKTNKIPTPSK